MWRERGLGPDIQSFRCWADGGMGPKNDIFNLCSVWADEIVVVLLVNH